MHGPDVPMMTADGRLDAIKPLTDMQSLRAREVRDGSVTRAESCVRAQERARCPWCEGMQSG